MDNRAGGILSKKWGAQEREGLRQRAIAQRRASDPFGVDRGMFMLPGMDEMLQAWDEAGVTGVADSSAALEKGTWRPSLLSQGSEVGSVLDPLSMGPLAHQGTAHIKESKQINSPAMQGLTRATRRR